MSKKAFLSFKSDDEFKVWALRNLAEFKNVEFEMDDVSLRTAINSRDDAYIKRVIQPKIESCQICICLIGENTYRSCKWVPWEINLAANKRKPIIAMRFKGITNAITPSVLTNLGIIPFDWDLNKLFRLISS